MEYEHLLRVYPALGYDVTMLPKVPVAHRADLVLGLPRHSRGSVRP